MGREKWAGQRSACTGAATHSRESTNAPPCHPCHLVFFFRFFAPERVRISTQRRCVGPSQLKRHVWGSREARCFVIAPGASASRCHGTSFALCKADNIFCFVSEPNLRYSLYAGIVQHLVLLLLLFVGPVSLTLVKNTSPYFRATCHPSCLSRTFFTCVAAPSPSAPPSPAPTATARGWPRRGCCGGWRRAGAGGGRDWRSP